MTTRKDFKRCMDVHPKIGQPRIQGHEHISLLDYVKHMVNFTTLYYTNSYNSYNNCWLVTCPLFPFVANITTFFIMEVK
jgi:hypothetical protein